MPNHDLWQSVRAVLFDLDGTLVEGRIDFGQLRRTAWALIHQSRIPLDPENTRDLIALANEACQYIEKREGWEQAERFRRALYAHWATWEQVYAARAYCVEGVDKLWRWLESRHVKIGVVTRNGRRVSMDVLERFNLMPDCLVTRDDYRYLKPDPHQLLHAAELLGVAPDQTVMIGDHPTDIQAGRAAGMRTVAVLVHDSTESRFADCPPDRFARSLEELIQKAR